MSVFDFSFSSSRCTLS